MATKIRVLLDARPLARVGILDEVKEAGVSFNNILSTQNVVILAILSVLLNLISKEVDVEKGLNLMETNCEIIDLRFG